jgi:HJR/Mrr/RecB family endonuclease
MQEVEKATYIIQTCHGMVLDVEQASKDKGAHIIQWEKTGGKNQHWRMQDPKDVTSSSDEWEGGW